RHTGFEVPFGNKGRRGTRSPRDGGRDRQCRLSRDGKARPLVADLHREDAVTVSNNGRLGLPASILMDLYRASMAPCSRRSPGIVWGPRRRSLTSWPSLRPSGRAGSRERASSLTALSTREIYEEPSGGSTPQCGLTC